MVMGFPRVEEWAARLRHDAEPRMNEAGLAFSRRDIFVQPSMAVVTCLD
jgi:hypothetical protein